MAASHIAVVCAYGVLADGELTNEARAWMAGIRAALGRQGHHLTVLTARRHHSDDHLFRQSVDADDFQGAILLGMRDDDGYLDYLLATGTPCVAFNRRPQSRSFSWVSMDNVDTGRVATEHLLSLNHRRIAICGDPSLLHINDRREGAITTSRKRSIEPVLISPLHIRMGEADFQAAVDELVAARATGVVVCDWAGARLVNALHERGVDVPGEMSVIDVGDMSLSTSIGRQLTSVGYDKHWVGEQLGDVVLRLINGRPHLRSIGEMFETWVVERETTAPPPA